MSLEDRLRRAEVEPLGAVNGELSHVFASVDPAVAIHTRVDPCYGLLVSARSTPVVV